MTNKKEKIKEFSKKYLIGFTLGMLSAGIVSVVAAAVFPSNQTTYDNSSTGMQATEVQGAIDELYTTCFPPGPTIGGQPVDVVESGDGLYEDEYEEDRYVYKGANPNNYIWFNEELWRIIAKESDGTYKITSTKARYSTSNWDTGGTNNWTRPASLNTSLNSYYSGLTSKAKSQIVSHQWGIGEIDPNNNDLKEQIETENSEIWTGNIGLISASDFLRSNSNIEECSTLKQWSVWSTLQTCKKTSYLMPTSNPSNVWTITASEYPYGSGMSSDYVMYISSQNGIDPTLSTTNAYHYPVTFLNSDIKVVSGTGSKSNPYTIE